MSADPRDVTIAQLQQENAALRGILTGRAQILANEIIEALKVLADSASNESAPPQSRHAAQEGCRLLVAAFDRIRAHASGISLVPPPT